MPNVTKLVPAIALSGWAAVAWANADPSPVSPGRDEPWAVVEGRCPGFSWSSASGAEAIELAVFALPEQDAAAASFDAESAELVIFERLPGGASAWTPAVDQCLSLGRRYAWTVRAQRGGPTEGDAERGDEWSRARLFEVSRQPSLEEVEAALDVLQRFRSPEGSSVARASRELEPNANASASDRAAEPGRGPAAVRRATPSTGTGPRLRVEGVISGDGSELTSVDAETLDGLDSLELATVSGLASSAGPAVHWNNLTAVPGDLADGDDDATYAGVPPISVVGTDVSLSDAGCAANELLVFTGSAWDCRALQGSSILDASIGNADLAINAVGAPQLQANAVTSSAILDGAISSNDLGPGSVGTSELQSNSVGAVQIQTDAVGSSEIAADAVGSSELAGNAVRKNELNGTEVTLYSAPAGCGAGVTTSTTCQTLFCSSSPVPTFLNCTGSCTQGASQSCNTTLLGYALSSIIGD